MGEAPLLLYVRERSGIMACRGAGGGGVITYDKGYYHSYLGRSRKEPFGHTRRLSRSRGALSPARAVAQRRSRAGGLTRRSA